MKLERKGTKYKNTENISAEKPVAFYALIQGRVQGVGFRYSAAREAHRLNIKGWVRNTDEGDVEVWAEGDPEKQKLFFEWLHRGPQLSRIDSVKKEHVEPVGYGDFNIR